VIAARVRLVPSGAVVELQPGERLVDALDEHGILAFATACRAANCGICMVRVWAGAEGLAPPNKDEVSLLSWLNAGADRRLGCQLRAVAAASDLPVDVELGPPHARLTQPDT
jgi:ferredoxin